MGGFRIFGAYCFGGSRFGCVGGFAFWGLRDGYLGFRDQSLPGF